MLAEPFYHSLNCTFYLLLTAGLLKKCVKREFLFSDVLLREVKEHLRLPATHSWTYLRFSPCSVLSRRTPMLWKWGEMRDSHPFQDPEMGDCPSFL